jgi:hypothetical protein
MTSVVPGGEIHWDLGDRILHGYEMGAYGLAYHAWARLIQAILPACAAYAWHR